MADLADLKEFSLADAVKGVGKNTLTNPTDLLDRANRTLHHSQNSFRTPRDALNQVLHKDFPFPKGEKVRIKKAYYSGVKRMFVAKDAWVKAPPPPPPLTVAEIALAK